MIESPVLVITRRKVCDDGCGFDKTITMSLDQPIIGREELDLSFRELKKTRSFTTHSHHSTIIEYIEIKVK